MKGHLKGKIEYKQFRDNKLAILLFQLLPSEKLRDEGRILFIPDGSTENTLVGVKPKQSDKPLDWYKHNGERRFYCNYDSGGYQDARKVTIYDLENEIQGEHLFKK